MDISSGFCSNSAYKQKLYHYGLLTEMPSKPIYPETHLLPRQHPVSILLI